MIPDINFHGIRSFKARSRSNPAGTNSWVTIEFSGKDPNDSWEVSFFIDAPMPRLLAGLIAKAINDAQIAHDNRGG